MACGVSILILLAGVISCSKDKHQLGSPPPPKTGELTVVLLLRQFDGSFLQIYSTKNFANTETDSKITFNNTPLQITTNIYLNTPYNTRQPITVFVPNPGNDIISDTIKVTVEGVGGKTTLHASYTINPLFNKNDIDQVKIFLSQKSGTKENIDILNENTRKKYTKDTDPENWSVFGIDFTQKNSRGKEADHDRRLTEFNMFPTRLNNGNLEGNLILTGCSDLRKVVVTNQKFKSINLTGAHPDLELYCAGNYLTSITLSHPFGITSSTINPQTTGALTTTDGLHYTLATP